ncbi:MAG: hypothetical protein Kow0059_00620 [Candidatus Sumerlaeia bacterium]
MIVKEKRVKTLIQIEDLTTKKLFTLRQAAGTVLSFENIETAMKKSTRQSSRTHGFARWLQQVTPLLMAAESMDELARLLAQVTDHLFKWDAFFFAERIGQSSRLRLIYFSDLVDGRRQVWTAEEDRDFEYDALPELAQGRPLLINCPRTRKTSKEPRLQRFGDESRPSASLVFAPVFINETMYAVLSVQSYTPARYRAGDRDLLKSLADLTAPVVRRIRAEEALRVSNERYRQAIAQADAVPYERDYDTGSIVFMGEGIKQLTGYATEEFSPDLWHEIVKEIKLLGTAGDHPQTEAIQLSHAGKLNNWRAEYRIRTRSGAERWLLDSSINLFDRFGRCYGSLGILQDITERKHSERLKEELSRLGERLNSISTRKEAAEIIADAADALLGWDACVVTLYDETANKTRSLLAVDTVEGQRREFVEDYDVPLEPSPLFQRVLEEGALLIAEREKDDTVQTRTFGEQSQRSQSLMFVPIHQQGKVIGLFSIQSYTPGRYTDQSLQTMQILADYGGAALARAAAVENLQERETRYRRAIAQANAVPYERNLATGQYDYMGEGIKELTGYSRQEMTPATWKKLVQKVVLYHDLAGLTEEEAARRVNQGLVRNWRADYQIRTRDGRERWVADSCIIMTDARGHPLSSIGLLQDITEQRRMLQINEALSALGRELSGAVSPKEAVRILARAAADLIGWDACFVTLCQEDERFVYNLLNVDTVDGIQKEFSAGYEGVEQITPMMRKTLEEGPQIVLRGADDDTPAEATFVKFGDVSRLSASLLYVPLRRSGGQAIGVFSIQSYTPRAYTPDDLALLQTLADHGSVALERALAEDRLRSSERRTALFAELARRLNSAQSPHDAGVIIAEIAEQLLGWDAFNFDLYDQARNLTYDVLNYDTIRGRKVAFNPDPRPAVPGAFGQRAVREGGFIIQRDPHQLQEANGLETSGMFGDTTRYSATLMFVPARFGDRITGIISLQSYTPYAYTPQDLETLQALADHCGGALERIRSQEILDAERRRTAEFADLGRRLSAAQSPREAARFILQTAQTLIGWDAGFLALYRPKTNELIPVLACDLMDGSIAEVAPDSLTGEPDPRTLTFRTLKEGKLLILRDPDSSPAPSPVLFGDTARVSASLMFVPIRHGEQPIGVLSIQSYTPRAYTADHLDILQVLADHCAGALERIEAERALIEERHQLRTLIDNLPDSIYFKQRDGSFVVNNRAHIARLEQVSGSTISDPAEVIGKTDFDFFPRDRAEAFYAEEQRILSTGEAVINREECSTDEQGRQVWHSATKVPLRDNEGHIIGLVGITRDITEIKEFQAQLQYAAFHDPLTGLANRALFMNRLQHCLDVTRRNPAFKFAVLYMDLDRFKSINDTHGHMAGDQLLRAVGERLRRQVRETDTVARLGGDEFTILLEDLVGDDHALMIGRRVLDDLARPFQIGDRRIVTAASVGITGSYVGYSNLEDVLRDADAALYRAKNQGRNQCVVFQPASREAGTD